MLFIFLEPLSDRVYNETKKLLDFHVKILYKVFVFALATFDQHCFLYLVCFDASSQRTTKRILPEMVNLSARHSVSEHPLHLSQYSVYSQIQIL